jgi:F-type H+-transporting ATPase subunit b
MNLIILALAQAAEDPPSVFNLNIGVSAWTFIIFIILLVILMKFAFPPILGYAEAREARIQDALDYARQQRDEAEQLLIQQRAELDRAREQAQALLAEGRSGAERVREDMLERARAEQEELLERARRDIQREREQAVEAVRREAVEVSIAAAGMLVQRRFEAPEDRRLVAEYLQSIDGAAGGSGAGAA